MTYGQKCFETIVRCTACSRRVKTCTLDQFFQDTSEDFSVTALALN